MDYKDGRSAINGVKRLTDFSIERILRPETFYETSNNVIRSLYPYYVFQNNFIASSIYFSNAAPSDTNENNWLKDDSLKCKICGKVFAFVFDLSVSVKNLIVFLEIISSFKDRANSKLLRFFANCIKSL